MGPGTRAGSWSGQAGFMQAAFLPFSTRGQPQVGQGVGRRG
jgi:hypothetical protein